MTTVEKTKRLIKSMRAQGDSEEQIASTIGIDVEEVYAFLKDEIGISNMEEKRRERWPHVARQKMKLPASWILMCGKYVYFWRGERDD